MKDQREATNHDCRKNHNGSAKAMEPAMAVDMLNKLDQKGLHLFFVQCTGFNHLFNTFQVISGWCLLLTGVYNNQFIVVSHRNIPYCKLLWQHI